MKRHLSSLAVALLGTTLANPANADWVSTNGPSGVVTRAFTLGDGGSRLLAGTAGGIRLASADFTSWTPVSGGPSGSVLSLATGVNESGGEVLIAGTQDAGVYASWNGGTTWSAVNTGLTEPTVPALIAIRDAYFGFGMVLLAGSEAGAFRSNGGQNVQWVPRSGGLANTDMQALVSVPGGDENDGIGARDVFGATAGGVFFTIDGVAWQPKNSGLPNSNVVALATTSSGPSGWTVFAGTSTGVVRSTDLYGSWNATGSGLSGAVQAMQGVGSRLFVGTAGGGVYFSNDAGDTWTAANSGLPNLQITALGSNGVDLFAATGAGVFRRPLTEFDGTTSVDDMSEGGVPLGVPRPNPFATSLQVNFRLDEASPVRLAVYDAQGRVVARLADGIHAQGTHQATWNGRDDSGAPSRAGVYFLRLESRGQFAASKRIALIR
jgi:FlgD Ig-like domain